MKSIPAKLAQAQLRQNAKRTAVTVAGAALSTAMMTAVSGFAISGIEAMRRLVGDQNIAQYQSVLFGLAAILGLIITAASVVVISGAFRISTAERTRQFGILKSVGATKRQIVQTMLYEALWLAGAAIPAGIVLGLLIQWLGVSIGDALLMPMNKLINNGLSIHMAFVFSAPALLLAAAVSLGTVLLSAWLPAAKAARIPAIEAIRLTRELKLRARRLRASRLIQALFGFEGTLAAKSIKRSRRSYRAMVSALAISVVLFMVCGSLDMQLKSSMNQAFVNIDADTVTSYTAGQPGRPPAYPPLNAQTAGQITQALRAYPDTAIYSVSVDDRYTLDIAGVDLTPAMQRTLSPEETRLPAALVMLDSEHYQALCRQTGVDEGSHILINVARQAQGGKTKEFEPLRYHGQTLTLEGGGEVLELPLHAQLTGADVPQEIAFAADAGILIVVPACTARMTLWFGASIDTEGFVAYAEETMASFFPSRDDGSPPQLYDVMDVSAVTDMTRSLAKLMTLFLYGFAGMLTLIGLTSVITSIAAGVRLRAREFAALVSAGMTQGGVRRMLALESVLSTLKALAYGVPAGAVGIVLVHMAVTRRDEFTFVFPWATLWQAALGVLLVALITTQYAAAKLRRGSIMDAIRQNEGV